MHTYTPAIRLYSKNSERLYLNVAERKRFTRAVCKLDLQTKLLCLVLIFTGCRITEALRLRVCDLHFDEDIIAITSIKKRNHHVRQIPVPRWLIKELKRFCKDKHPHFKPYDLHRSTAWRRVVKIMHSVGIKGSHATLKGLRHSFAVHCALNGVAITLCQKWMGHSSIEITACYYRLVGKEERDMARKLW